MGVITRFVDILNSNINSALDKAEKPEQMIRMLVQEMEEALVEVRSHAAQMIAEKKQYQRQVDDLRSRVADWQDKAEMALSKGREDLAKKALVEKSTATQELTNLESHLNSIDESLNAISADATALQTKLNEAREKQKAITRREQSAAVKLASVQSKNTDKMAQVNDRYERLHQKVVLLESQVEAYDLTASVTLLDEFRELEAGSKVEDELQALKKKVANV